MTNRSKIEWTDVTWNPFVGEAGRWHCVKVSPGCARCYAERINLRFKGPRYAEGEDVSRLDVRTLDKPLRWRADLPRMAFVCSMTDLFLEAHDLVDVARVFEVIRLSQAHTFQVLTKRPERAARFFEEHGPPPPNAWVGVSVENARWARERLPILANIPALRFASYEPALGPVNWRPYLDGLDWVIVGGESGGGARACRLSWVRTTIAQCRRAGVACFVKQLGARVEDETMTGIHARMRLRHPKGGDPEEWPDDLRVRKWPT